MNWKTKNFASLSNEELYKILRLRNEVFVVEQNCVYQDADAKDQKAIHVFLEKDMEIIAYLRIFKPGDYFENASIGRVVVSPKYRKKELGKELMCKGISYVLEILKEKTIEISAQVYLNKFYNELGFKQIGTPYLEDGIPHCKMFLKK